MGLFGDDDFDDIYPADLYPEYDFNRDGHINAFEATEIAAKGFEDHDISGDEGPISELEDYGVDFNSFLAMNDAEKYKILQDAVILNEFDYIEYFDNYARISGMDEELIKLCEYGIDPYEFEDADDNRRYQMLKEAGIHPEDYEEYFDKFDDRELRAEEVDDDNSFEEDDLEDSIIDTSGDDGMNEEKKKRIP